MSNLTEVGQFGAREELVKFFLIAEMADHSPQMFSQYIDQMWHSMLGSPGYDEFCVATVGHKVGHVEDAGYGVVSWVETYHDRFGALPAVWFADEHGHVDQDAYNRYLATRDPATAQDQAAPVAPLITAWDCTPTTGDPDYAKAKPAPGFVTAWDCTPTTGDPDFVERAAAELVAAG